MISHLLRDFKLSAVFQVSSYASSTEGMTADLRFNLRISRIFAYHAVHAFLKHRIRG